MYVVVRVCCLDGCYIIETVVCIIADRNYHLQSCIVFSYSGVNKGAVCWLKQTPISLPNVSLRGLVSYN